MRKQPALVHMTTIITMVTWLTLVLEANCTRQAASLLFPPLSSFWNKERGEETARKLPPCLFYSLWYENSHATRLITTLCSYLLVRKFLMATWSAFVKIPSQMCFAYLFLHCKKLEVDLTPKMSSQLQCGFIQVQVVVHLLLQGFRVTPLPVKLSSKQWIGLQMKFILWLHVCAKRG